MFEMAVCRIYRLLNVKKITGSPIPFDRGPQKCIFGQQDSTSPHSATTSRSVHVGLNRRFPFGKHFREITQPLDRSLEVTHDSASLSCRKPPRRWVYIIRCTLILPTPRAAPHFEALLANQYSVTHTERKPHAHSCVPGISFKFDIEPVRVTPSAPQHISLVFHLVRHPLFALSCRLISVNRCFSDVGAYSSARPGPLRNRPGYRRTRRHW